MCRFLLKMYLKDPQKGLRHQRWKGNMFNLCLPTAVNVSDDKFIIKTSCESFTYIWWWTLPSYNIPVEFWCYVHKPNWIWVLTLWFDPLTSLLSEYGWYGCFINKRERSDSFPLPVCVRRLSFFFLSLQRRILVTYGPQGNLLHASVLLVKVKETLTDHGQREIFIEVKDCINFSEGIRILGGGIRNKPLLQPRRKTTLFCLSCTIFVQTQR